MQNSIINRWLQGRSSHSSQEIRTMNCSTHLSFKIVIMIAITIASAKAAGVLDATITKAKQPLKCGVNEHCVDCPTECPPLTCDAIGKAYPCPILPPGGNKNCEPGCQCDFNYRRNDCGICIPIWECPPLKCQSPNEVYDPCPPECPDKTCENLQGNGTCVQQVNPDLECSPQCRCAPGYFRNSNNSCVLEADCSDCNGRGNTTLYGCYACSPRCDGQVHACPQICSLVPRFCGCRPDYLLNAAGLCVLKEDC